MDAAGYDLPEGRRVDMPPRACSRSYYPNLTALYDAAKVQLAPFSWAFSYSDASDPSGKPYFRVDGGSTTDRSSTVCGFRLPKMSEWSKLFTVSNLKLALDAIRFHVAIRRDVTNVEVWERRTFGEYLEKGRYSDEFVVGGLLPMLSMVCTCSYENIRRYPAAVIMRYLVVSSSHEQFRTKNGTQNAARTLAKVAKDVRYSTRVLRVIPGKHGTARPLVRHVKTTRSGQNVGDVVDEAFDVVIIGAPANVAATMLDHDDAGDDIKKVSAALRSVEHETSRVVLHRNPIVMPRDKQDWAAMAMICENESKSRPRSSSSRVMFTMYASHEDVLALDESKYGPLFMTWNPFNRYLPPPKQTQAFPGVAVHNDESRHKIMSNVTFERPLVTLSTKRAVDTIWDKQGTGGIYVVGAYTLFDVPLQENAVASSVAVADRLGVTIPFEPAGRAKLRGQSRPSPPKRGPRFVQIVSAVLLFVSSIFLTSHLFFNSSLPWNHVPVSSVLRDDASLRDRPLDVFTRGWRALTFDMDRDDTIRVMSYFVALAVSVRTSLYNWTWNRCARERPFFVAAVAFALMAWYVTWRLIFSYFIEFEQRGETTNMFLDAYVKVSDDPVGWLWSSQLLLWVVPATIYVYVESARRDVSNIVSASWIGAAFLGAVSLGFPLALSHLELSESQRTRSAVTSTEILILFVCATLSIASVHVMPTMLSDQRLDMFAAALGLLHVALVFPFMARAVLKRKTDDHHTIDRMKKTVPSFALSFNEFASRFGVGVLYVCVAVASTAIHLLNVRRAVPSFSVWNPVDTAASVRDLVVDKRGRPWRNSCQSSIDFDVIFTCILTATFVFQRCPSIGKMRGFRKIFIVGGFALITWNVVPVVSLATAFACVCVLLETGLVL